MRAAIGEAKAWMEAHLAKESYGDECIEWPFSKTGGGHGQYNRMGAHRYVLIQTRGEPVGERNCCAHSCGNAACVNPNHLRWATHAENMQDMKVHGTWPEGENAGRAKITKDDAVSIFLDARTHREIAAEYGVTASNVSCIKRGISWSKYTCHLALDPTLSRFAVRKKRKSDFKAKQLSKWRPRLMQFEISNPGCDRDICIRYLRSEGATLQVIGDLYSISRERVRQILT